MEKPTRAPGGIDSPHAIVAPSSNHSTFRHRGIRVLMSLLHYGCTCPQDSDTVQAVQSHHRCLAMKLLLLKILLSSTPP